MEDVAEQRLAGPAGRQVKPHPAYGAVHARADFEEPQSDRVDRRRGELGAGLLGPAVRVAGLIGGENGEEHLAVSR